MRRQLSTAVNSGKRIVSKVRRELAPEKVEKLKEGVLTGIAVTVAIGEVLVKRAHKTAKDYSKFVKEVYRSTKVGLKDLEK